MAGEVGHVVYANKVLDHIELPEMPDISFWAGTLFPDIKHLGVISRHRTHPQNVSLDFLKGENDFDTGMRVHAWVDEARNRYYQEAGIKEALPWHPFVPHALKLLEDEYLYDSYTDWNLIQRALAKTYPEELHYINSKEHVLRWHTILQDYFAKKPNADSRRELSVAIGLSEASADEINTVVITLKEDDRARELIESWLDKLKVLLR